MIMRVKSTVKRVTHIRQSGRWVFLGSILVLLFMILGTIGVAAMDPKPENAVGFYVKDGKTTWLIPGQGIQITNTLGLTLGDIEKLYPLTLKAESAIVHSVPSSPVIIDGVQYSADQISLFNGKRLRFITGTDNNLYAFTTLEGFEQFKEKQFGQRSLQKLLDVYSYFFQNIGYTGNYCSLIAGTGLPDLSQIGMDNIISSTQINTSTQWAYLFDYADYGGDWYGMAPGSTYPALINQGWNDRASSVWINQN